MKIISEMTDMTRDDAEKTIELLRAACDKYARDRGLKKTEDFRHRYYETMLESLMVNYPAVANEVLLRISDLLEEPKAA